MDIRAASLGRSFWFWWLVATLIGWIVGMLGAIVLSHLVVNLLYPKETNLIVGLCVGAAVGFSQKIAARRWLTLTKGWIWGAMVGIGIPFVAAVLAEELGFVSSDRPENMVVGVTLVAVAGGVITGIIQAKVLRPYTSRSNWWIIASVVSWGLAWLISGTAGSAGFLGGGLVLGLISGGCLLWLLRTPAEATTG